MRINTAQLVRQPLFDGIREEDLPAMLDCLGGFGKCFRKGEVLLLESRDVRHVGLVLDGMVHMVQDDADGNQTLLVAMGAGELFGESFACGSTQQASVAFVAAASCTVLFLPFRKVIRTCSMTCAFHHRLIENMVRLIGDKNVRLMQKVSVISRKTLRGKILAYLRNRAAEEQTRRFAAPLGRTALAEYLCADRSALTRELAAMRAEGLIDYDRTVFELFV